MNIGQIISGIRKSKNMTIKEIAKKAQISTSLISQIENNKANPSLYTLNAIAEALQVNIASFFLIEKVDNPVLRSTERLLKEMHTGSTYYLISKEFFKNIEITYRIYDLSYKKKDYPIADFNGFELAFVVDGILKIQVEDEVYLLNSGDTICFESSKPHRVLGPEIKKAEVLWINIYNN